jgi:hypothetical protein
MGACETSCLPLFLEMGAAPSISISIDSVHCTSTKQESRTYSILPAFSRLVDQRLDQICRMSREFVPANGLAIVTKAFVEERVPEASWTPVSDGHHWIRRAVTYLCD